MVDSTDDARMEESGEELNNLLAEEKLAGVPLLVFANKQDLDLAQPEDAVSMQGVSVHQNVTKTIFQLTETLQLTSIKDRHWRIQLCSAINNEGVEVSLHDMSLCDDHISNCTFDRRMGSSGSMHMLENQNSSIPSINNFCTTIYSVLKRKIVWF